MPTLSATARSRATAFGAPRIVDVSKFAGKTEAQGPPSGQIVLTARPRVALSARPTVVLTPRPRVALE